MRTRTRAIRRRSMPTTPPTGSPSRRPRKRKRRSEAELQPLQVTVRDVRNRMAGGVRNCGGDRNRHRAEGTAERLAQRVDMGPQDQREGERLSGRNPGERKSGGEG